MLTIFAALVTLLCVLGSARRIAFAVRTTALDPKTLLAALKGGMTLDEIARRLERAPDDAEWERALVAAIRSEGPIRAALVNEQLTELDFRAERWARVPRVCASVATSAGFLLASLALRDGLMDTSAVVDQVVTRAIDVAAMGLCGAAFCIAAQLRARAIVKDRLAAVDKLVERLEALVVRGAPSSAPVVPIDDDGRVALVMTDDRM